MRRKEYLLFPPLLKIASFFAMTVYTVQQKVPTNDGTECYDFPVIRKVANRMYIEIIKDKGGSAVICGEMYREWETYGAARKFQRKFGSWQSHHPLSGFASFIFQPEHYSDYLNRYIRAHWQVNLLACKTRHKLTWSPFTSDADGEMFQSGEGFAPYYDRSTLA